MRPVVIRYFHIAFLALLSASSLSAQWLTQTNSLKGGWNTVYLSVDASYAPIDTVVAGNTDIQEIWLWNPPTASQQFITSPSVPITGAAGWTKWTRALGSLSPLQRLAPNAAYYVRVSESVTSSVWRVKGVPVAPIYQWLSSGLNFIGFSVPNPTTYEAFFNPVPSLLQNAEIFRSDGGAFGSYNPQRVFDMARTTIRPGEAVWMRVPSTYNRYFGPFEVNLPSIQGVNFGTQATKVSVRLRNQLPYTNVITLSLRQSELPPTGQLLYQGVPPLVVRGQLNATSLTYSAILLNVDAGLNPGDSPIQWALPPAGQPGADMEVVIGLMRGQISSPPGTPLGGILTFSDSSGLIQVNVAVSAAAQSPAGLWVGDAEVSQVSQNRKSYLRNPDGSPTQGRRWVSTTVGTFSGSDTGQGLDLAGIFPISLFFRSSGSITNQLGNALFSRSLATNLLVASDAVSNLWTAPSLGTNSSRQALSNVLGAALVSGSSRKISVQLPVTQGLRYRLQLLFMERSSESKAPHRGFDVSMNGQTVFPNLVPSDYLEALGSYPSQVSMNGVVLTREFTADFTTLNLELNGNTATSPSILEKTPFLNALSLEQLDGANVAAELSAPVGSYISTATNQSMGAVSRPVKLRLILHDDGTNSSLLQRVYYGFNAQTNPIVAIRQSLLNDSLLASAHRISSIHLPWTVDNFPLLMVNDGYSLTASVSTPYDATPSNPFIHQYHPDHDNLDSAFAQVLPKGRESFAIQRVIRLTAQDSGTDFESLTTGSGQRRGVYQEQITLEGSPGQIRTIQSKGTYLLNLISPVAKLTIQ